MNAQMQEAAKQTLELSPAERENVVATALKEQAYSLGAFAGPALRRSGDVFANLIIDGVDQYLDFLANPEVVAALNETSPRAVFQATIKTNLSVLAARLSAYAETL